MTDRERIEAELNRGYSDHLNAVADTYEEQGDPWMARAYRWLADNHKTPARNKRGRWQWNRHVTGESDSLPSLAGSMLLPENSARMEPNCDWNESTTISKAFHRAAIGVVEMLQEIDAVLPQEASGGPSEPRQSRRTKSQVLAERQNAVGGGCCNNFADYMSCTCLADAVDDTEGAGHP